MPSAIPLRANATTQNLTWTVLTSAVVDRNGTAVRALGTTYRDARWSWGLPVDAEGRLIDGEDRVVDENLLSVGLLLNSSTDGNSTVLENGILLILRNSTGSQPNQTAVDLDSSPIFVGYRGTRLTATHANGSWSLLLPRTELNGSMAELASFVASDPDPGTPYLVARVFPGVFVNETASYVKLLGMSNRGTIAWQVDVPRAFGNVGRNGTTLSLGGRARDLFVLLIHDWEAGNFTTWFLPVTEGFPFIAPGVSPFVEVRHQTFLPVAVNGTFDGTTNGTNATFVMTSTEQNVTGFLASLSFQDRPAFRGSMLAPQLTDDGALVFIPSFNGTTNQSCLLMFNLTEATDTFFFAQRNPSTNMSATNRILAECRGLPAGDFDRWQLLETRPELLNPNESETLLVNGSLQAPGELQLIMLADGDGVTLMRWADLGDGPERAAGGIPANWTTAFIGFSSDVDLVPAAFGMNLSYFANVTLTNETYTGLNGTSNVTTELRYARSNMSMLYLLSSTALQLGESNVLVSDQNRRFLQRWTRPINQLWPIPPANQTGRNAILFVSPHFLGLCLAVNASTDTGNLVFVNATTGRPLAYRPYYLPCSPDRGSILVTNTTWDYGVLTPTSNLTLVLVGPTGGLTVVSLPCQANGEPLLVATMEIQFSMPSSNRARRDLGDNMTLPPTVVFPPNQILSAHLAFGNPYVPPPNDPISGQIIAGVNNFTFGLIIVLMVLVIAVTIGLGIWFLKGNRFGKKTHPSAKVGAEMTQSAHEGASPSMATSSSRTPLAESYVLEGSTAAQTPRASSDVSPEAVERGSPTPGNGARDIRLAAALAAARVVSSLRRPDPDGLGISGAGQVVDAADRVIVVSSPAVGSVVSGDSESTYNWNDPQLAGAVMMTRRPIADEPVVVRSSLDTPAYVDLGADSRPPVAPIDPRSSTARMARGPMMGHRYTMSDELGTGTVVSSQSVTDPDDGGRGRDLQSVPSSTGHRTAVDDVGSSTAG